MPRPKRFSSLQKDPSKHPVRGKLLEIYAARKDVKAFETTAGELYAATQGHGPEWDRAASLGAQLDPANPMYASAVGQMAAADVHADGAHAAAASTLPSPVAPMGMGGAHDMLTPTLNEAETLIQPHLSEPLELPELRSRAPDDLGFDLNLGDSLEKTAAPKLDLELPETKLDHVLSGGAQAAPAAAAAGKGPLDFGGINLDLGPMTSSGPVGADARWQEVATKLDLAKAYHEMGDRDGARELLGEVAKEGDAAQQQQAKKLLETIG
jgi:pilus assembly protein FimV